MEDYDIIQRNFRFKPDEIFPRIKISLLVSLICESAYMVAGSSNPETGEEKEYYWTLQSFSFQMVSHLPIIEQKTK